MTNRWLLSALADRCEPLRAELSQRDVDGEAVREAATYRPGSINNPYLSARGWAIDYVELTRCHARLDAKTDPAEREKETSAILLLAALIDAPAPVVATSGLVKAYPKSIAALEFMAPLFDRLGLLEKEKQECAGGDGLELKALYELVGWCATYSSPALPFTDLTEVPKPPAWLGYLGAERLQRIAETSFLLETDRAEFLRSLMSIEGREKPILTAESGNDPQWIVDLSEQLETTPETLKTDWSQTSLLGLMAIAQQLQTKPPDDGSGGSRLVTSALIDAGTRDQISPLN